ncbi:MAG: protein-(glutamine-N5) methyltransferase, release factor-specific [Elusimicrobia bacterium RIFOXYD2_FULL_34_15]|nr:MAG: protein-(glutamine-N5) methyltransferase, release factor-specific [Elusimicrobia bacterium RIFOXYD2_FULL_34_15]
MNSFELLNWGKSTLGSKYGFDTKVILAHCLNIKINDVYIYSGEIKPQKSKLYKKLINARKQFIPTEYLTGDTEFMGLKYFVNKNVLIPRQETEILVQEAIKLVKNNKKSINILDIGTGSGNIGISIAKYLKNVNIIAIDISEEAIKVAIKNAKINRIQSKIKFIKSDLFNFTANYKNAKFDLIISNPPYIKTNEINRLQKEILNEPRIALDGGKDGLKFYNSIIPESRRYLNKNGYLMLEIGYHHSKQIKKTMEANGYKNINILKDYLRQERVAYGQNHN